MQGWLAYVGVWCPGPVMPGHLLATCTGHPLPPTHHMEERRWCKVVPGSHPTIHHLHPTIQHLHHQAWGPCAPPGGQDSIETLKLLYFWNEYPNITSLSFTNLSTISLSSCKKKAPRAEGISFQVNLTHMGLEHILHLRLCHMQTLVSDQYSIWFNLVRKFDTLDVLFI